MIFAPWHICSFSEFFLPQDIGPPHWPLLQPILVFLQYPPQVFTRQNILRNLVTSCFILKKPLLGFFFGDIMFFRNRKAMFRLPKTVGQHSMSTLEFHSKNPSVTQAFIESSPSILGFSMAARCGCFVSLPKPVSCRACWVGFHGVAVFVGTWRSLRGKHGVMTEFLYRTWRKLEKSRPWSFLKLICSKVYWWKWKWMQKHLRLCNLWFQCEDDFDCRRTFVAQHIQANQARHSVWSTEILDGHPQHLYLWRRFVAYRTIRGSRLGTSTRGIVDHPAGMPHGNLQLALIRTASRYRPLEAIVTWKIIYEVQGCHG